MTTFHMDIRVLQKSLSCRLLKVDSALEAFKDSLSRWRTVYQNEKRSAMVMVKLSKKCYQLSSQIESINGPSQVILWLKDVNNVLDCIISNSMNPINFLPELCLVPPNMTETRVAYQWTDNSDSSIFEDLRIMLRSSPEADYQLLNLIIEAVSSNGLRGCLPQSFLFLGLKDNAKADLVKALHHVFKSESGCESIIQINMEEYIERDSMIQFVDRISAVALTVVIIMSDLGNKDVLGLALGAPYGKCYQGRESPSGKIVSAAFTFSRRHQNPMLTVGLHLFRGLRSLFGVNC